MKSFTHVVRILSVAVAAIVGLSTNANANDLVQNLENSVGTYISTDNSIHAELIHQVITARMGAGIGYYDTPLTTYDYFSFQGEHQGVNSVIDIYVPRNSDTAVVCDGDHTPVVDSGIHPVDPNQLFVYNQACTTVNLPNNQFSYIERQLMIYKVGVSLSFLDNGGLQITKYDTYQTGFASLKQIVKVVNFNRVR
jgi:hypothetical protein